MPQETPIPLGNVVSAYTDGGTHIVVCDDACRARTTEQQQASLDAWAALAARCARPAPEE